jgi:Ca-activated chloride channel homolog
MNTLLELLQPFHFLRPLWLLVIPGALLLWWLTRKRLATPPPWAQQIAPHLLVHLTIRAGSRGRILPVDLVALALVIGGLAASGPAWRPVPNPFVSETAPLVVALELSETMLATDIQPTRLERAKMKVVDLVSRRTGAHTGLIVYAGSAHVVLPLTDDPAIMAPFLESVSPSIMPTPGDSAASALELAEQLLADEETPGSILLVTDGVSDADIDQIAAQASSNSLVALVVGSEEGGSIRHEDGTLVAAPTGGDATLDRGRLARLETAGVTVIEVVPGDGDVDAALRAIASELQNALDADGNIPYRDEGWWFVWPMMLLALLCFRRGWVVRTGSILLAISYLGASSGTVRAQSTVSATAEEPAVDTGDHWFVDLWLTRDQQGKLALERNEPGEAAYLFQDPMWRGTAAYQAGRYGDAAADFSRTGTADGFFNMGTALVKARDYQQALTAFEQALSLDPEHAGAKRNLEVTQALIAYLNALREDSSTGDQQELGADEVVFDLEPGEGTERTASTADQMKIESAEQWMRTVETRAADFLRTRFALEAQMPSVVEQAP